MTFSEAITQIRSLAAEDITGIVGNYMELKRSGNGAKGCCPFHQEKTPSFHVSGRKGIYKCFGCGVGGDAIDFLMRMEAKEFHEVIYLLADRFHLSIDSNRQKETVHRRLPAIANIQQLRPEIRKEDRLTIVLNDAPLDQFETKAIARLTPPLLDEQALLVKKYTDQCSLVLRGVEWPLVLKSVQAALSNELHVTIWNNGEYCDWLDALLRVYAAEREDIISCLAAIADPLMRSVYTTEYANQLNPRKQVSLSYDGRNI